MNVLTVTTFEDAKEIYRHKDFKQALYDAGEVVMDGVLVNLHGEFARGREHQGRGVAVQVAAAAPAGPQTFEVALDGDDEADHAGGQDDAQVVGHRRERGEFLGQAAVGREPHEGGRAPEPGQQEAADKVE